MFCIQQQLIIGTLLGLGFLSIAGAIIAVCFFWILAWTIPVAWRVWSLWKAFSAYRRGESFMLMALSAISPKLALWAPRLSAIVFHLLGRPSPPNWRAQHPPSFAEAAHMANEEAQPNEGWLRQANRDRMMSTRNEPFSAPPSNISSNQSQFSAVPPPSYSNQSAEAAEGGWLVEGIITVIQLAQHYAQQLAEKLSKYRTNNMNASNQYSSQPTASQSFDPTINAPESQHIASSVSGPPKQPTSFASEGVKRRHPYPTFHEDESSHYQTPQPSAPIS